MTGGIMLPLPFTLISRTMHFSTLQVVHLRRHYPIFGCIMDVYFFQLKRILQSVQIVLFADTFYSNFNIRKARICKEKFSVF
jgi:hypothetical protein